MSLFWMKFSILASILCTIIMYKNSGKYTQVAIPSILLFLAGIVVYDLQRRNAFRNFNRAHYGIVSVEGVVYEREDIDNKTLLTLHVHSIKNRRTQRSWNTSTYLKARLPRTHTTPEVGDTITFKKVFVGKPPTDSYRNYLIKENLLGYTQISPASILLHPHTKPSAFYQCKRYFSQKRRAVLASLKRKLSPTSYTLTCTLFFGIKPQGPILSDIKDLFRRWGLMHFLARSGLHLVILIMLLSVVMKWLPLSFNIRTLSTFILITLYASITISSISFLRAYLLFALYTICTLFDLQINKLHLLSLVTITILLWNPYQLFFLDFQLSFGLMFAIAWYLEYTKS